jgi:hypothetical protein
MKSDWQAVLEDTLIIIKKKAGLSELPTTKTGFSQLIAKHGTALADPITVGVEYLAQRIVEFIPEAKDFKPSKKRGLFRREIGLGEDRKAAILKGKKLEVALEHAIVASVDDDGLFNHYALLSGIYNSSTLCKQVAVDLVVKHDSTFSLIELKAWDNKSDSPADALLEISAYFLTYQRMLESDSTLHGGRFEKADKFNLILMAPPAYFDYWGVNNNNWYIFRSAFEAALGGHGVEVKVNIAVIDISRDDFIKSVISIEEEGKSFKHLPQDLKLRISNAFERSMNDLA